jgi:hypothetical protein
MVSHQTQKRVLFFINPQILVFDCFGRNQLMLSQHLPIDFKKLRTDLLNVMVDTSGIIRLTFY